MTAREMFEKLGYNYTLESDNYIDYCTNGFSAGSCIVQFQKFNKTYRIINIFSEAKKDIQNRVVIDMQLHNAINKQIEELGWDNE